MGQILDRISRLAKAYWSDNASEYDWADRALNSEDEELKRIIDELNKEPLTPRAPEHVIEALGVLNCLADATEKEARASYRLLMSQWHPDKFVSAGPKEQETARSRSREINAAYVIVKAYFVEL